jgi:hypothetical protein
LNGASPVVGYDGRPAGIEGAASGLDAEALFATRLSAKGIVRISGEVRVLMAGVPVVKVMVGKRVKGGRVLLSVRDESDLKLLTSNIDIGGVEVKETAPSRGTTTLLVGARLWSKVLVGDVVVEEVRTAWEDISATKVSELVGNQRLNRFRKGLIPRELLVVDLDGSPTDIVLEGLYARLGGSSHAMAK